ncbi:MAG TPA: 1-phosphofructokinase family hexose kinase [Feifaniaceae bacterium]|nr:1-phosphofructokinase family hexose kinase [Feifaniaceae bacterium]
MILTVTLNPAMDLMLFVDSFAFNTTNRVVRTERCIGGKGTHISHNLADLGVANTATGIAMGRTGEELVRVLKGAGVTCRFFTPEGGETRTNYALIDNAKNCTLISTKGPELTKETLDAFLSLYRELVSGVTYVVISGDASNFTDGKGVSLQAALFETAKQNGAKVLLDASGKSLEDCVKRSPYLIKPNVHELAELTKLPVNTEREIIAAIESLNPHRISVVAVSMGGEGSIVRYGAHYYKVSAAKVKVQNTIGCGDAYLSGLLYGMHSGMTPEDTLRFAAACGGAEAESERTVGLNKARVLALVDTINVQKVV